MARGSGAPYIRNTYPLPLIPGILKWLSEAKESTSLAGHLGGYNNIRIKEGDKWKVALL